MTEQSSWGDRKKHKESLQRAELPPAFLKQASALCDLGKLLNLSETASLSLRREWKPVSSSMRIGLPGSAREGVSVSRAAAPRSKMSVSHS